MFQRRSRPALSGALIEQQLIHGIVAGDDGKLCDEPGALILRWVAAHKVPSKLLGIGV